MDASAATVRATAPAAAKRTRPDFQNRFIRGPPSRGLFLVFGKRPPELDILPSPSAGIRPSGAPRSRFAGSASRRFEPRHELRTRRETGTPRPRIHCRRQRRRLSATRVSRSAGSATGTKTGLAALKTADLGTAERLGRRGGPAQVPSRGRVPAV